MATALNFDHIRRLVDEGKKDEARRTLSSLLYRNSKDAQAWWLYAQVAEDKDQLYHILEALVELPINPYTARARAMLHSMPYQRPKENGGMQARARRGSNLWLTLVAFVATILVIVVGAGLLLAVSPRLVPSVAGQPATTPTVRSQTVALAARPTGTPVPTATATATRTPRPTATRVEPSATPSPSPLDLAKALPSLNKFLLDHSSALDTAAADMTKALADSDKISIDALGKATTQAQNIRKLRNDVTLLNISSSVPPDLRQQIIFPAHVAYTDYANGILQWMDLQIQAYRAYTVMVQASPTDLANARKEWAKQTALVAKQADLIKLKRAALNKALIAYNAYTAKAVLTVQLSSAANIFDSLDKQSIQLSGGKYKVVYQVALAEGGKPTLKLMPNDGTGPKLQLIGGGTKPDFAGSQTVDLPAGFYTVSAESLAWWVVAFDPQ